MYILNYTWIRREIKTWVPKNFCAFVHFRQRKWKKIYLWFMSCDDYYIEISIIIRFLIREILQKKSLAQLNAFPPAQMRKIKGISQQSSCSYVCVYVCLFPYISKSTAQFSNSFRWRVRTRSAENMGWILKNVSMGHSVGYKYAPKHFFGVYNIISGQIHLLFGI